MGMALAFGGGSFANMGPGNLKLSRVLQKNVATFDELGGRVDSVTAGEMVLESCIRFDPWFMRVDRPFISVVADSATGGIILASVVNKPERAPTPQEEKDEQGETLDRRQMRELESLDDIVWE